MRIPLAPESFGLESLATNCFGFKSITLNDGARF